MSHSSTIIKRQNYRFALFNKNVIFSRTNTILTYFIPETYYKTVRVYFGMLQFSHPYKNFVLEIHTMSFACSISGPFFSCLLPMAFLIFSFHLAHLVRDSHF